LKLELGTTAQTNAFHIRFSASRRTVFAAWKAHRIISVVLDKTITSVWQILLEIGLSMNMLKRPSYLSYSLYKY
jgi:hypothetical protein